MNLVCLAVQTSQAIGEVFGFDSAAYRWDGFTYQPLSAVEILDVAQPVWVDVPASRVVCAVGSYDPQMADVNVPAGQSVQAWPRLEPFAPAVHLQGQARLHSFDAFAGSWFLGDPTLPEFLSNMPPKLPASTGFWCSPTTDAALSSAATESHDIIFYHTDHLGSSNVLTDVNGNVVQEMASYPFGHSRHDYTANDGIPFRADYRFTGKELDKESKLMYYGARYYAPAIGKFVSVDPLSHEPTATVGAPLKGQAYAYARNNPIMFVDPSGRDEEIPEYTYEETYTTAEVWALIWPKVQEKWKAKDPTLQFSTGGDIFVLARPSPNVKRETVAILRGVKKIGGAEILARISTEVTTTLLTAGVGSGAVLTRGGKLVSKAGAGIAKIAKRGIGGVRGFFARRAERRAALEVGKRARQLMASRKHPTLLAPELRQMAQQGWKAPLGEGIGPQNWQIGEIHREFIRTGAWPKLAEGGEMWSSMPERGMMWARKAWEAARIGLAP